MVDTTKLYSHQGQEPQILPHEITLSNGRSRTDNTSFTEEEIVNAGFTGPYEKPEYDVDTQQLVWNSSTLSYSVEDLPDGSPSPERLLEMLRENRNYLLERSDWTQLSDSPLSSAKVAEWKAFRQLLRDFTETVDLPETYEEFTNLDWPVRPE